MTSPPPAPASAAALQCRALCASPPLPPPPGELLLLPSEPLLVDAEGCLGLPQLLRGGAEAAPLVQDCSDELDRLASSMFGDSEADWDGAG